MIGSTLEGRYKIVAKLGEGGMGIVYRGHDPLLKRDVAIKMVPPIRLDAKNEERFRREARLVAQMDHRSIVPIHDLGGHEGSLFIVMPLVEGVTLRQRIDARDLPPDEAVRIAVEVAEALAHSHARGVIHRDVKPENIMVSEEGEGLRVRVMDFGLAWDSEEKLSHSGAVGTPAYLSPEQLKNEELDERTDLYALGTTLYECLSGQPPFEGPIHSMIYRIGHEPPPPLVIRNQPADPELQAIVSGCLAKRPEERPANASELAAQLRGYLQRIGDPTGSWPPDPARPSRVRRSGAVVGTSQEAVLPMVGRQEVWTVLQQQLDAALGGECQMAFVGGEAGMGKTRTLQELEALVCPEGILVLRGRYSDIEEGFPYEGLCDLIRDYFRPGGAWSRASEGGAAPELGDLAGELLRLFPIFSEIPELRRIAKKTREEGEMTRVLLDHGSETERTYVFELLARTLIRLGDGRPLVLLLESLHSAYASIEALRYIVYRLGPTPTLIVGSYRSDQVDRAHPLRRLMQGFTSDARFRSLRLKPLTAAEVKRMAELVVGAGELETDLAERLYEATEGNPLFVQELVRSLCESGSMTRDSGEGGHWRLSGETALTSQVLPATVQQVIEARLERLPEEPRRVLTFGAVFGKSFDYADLEEIYDGTDDDLDVAVERLVAEGILREDRESRGDRLYFSSRLVRDLLYQSLPRRRRRALHRRCAERLEARSTGHEERIYPLLVHHYSAGDVPDKTVTYALKQARRALRAASADDAIRAAKIALEFVEEEEVEGSRHLAGELFEILARAHRYLGQYRRSLKNAARAATAFAEAGEPDKEARAALLAAQVAWQGRQIEATRLWVDRGVEAGRGKASGEDLRRLLALGSTVANLRGETLLAKLYREEAERLEPKTEAEHAPEESVPRGGTLRAVLPLGIGEIDPARLESDEHGEVLTMVFETLLGIDDEGHLVPALCTEWEEAEDGRLFHLRLRPGVRFGDGHLLSARDVKASFERLAKARVDSPVPALAWVEGREAFVNGEADEIRGLQVGADEPSLELSIRLLEPLPIYPSLLTDPYTAVVRLPEGPDSGRVGTGPFELVRRDPGKVLLRGKARHWRGAPPQLDAVEFLTSLSPSDVVARLRDGTLDVGRGLVGDDLEAVLRDPVLGRGLVETTQRNVHFILCNVRGPVSRHRELRRALLGVVRTNDLVWRTLGRFAQPASSLVPPGLLGHDPGRRRTPLAPNESREILEATGLALPVRLNAVIHPVLLDRGIELVKALLAEFLALGVQVDFEPRPIASYLEAYESNDDVDLLIGRWNADYDDPDTFTHTLFDSRHGLLRRYYSSPEADRCLERGRQETVARERQRCYFEFQQILEREHVLLPLFHDVSYRVAGPKVRGLRLRNSLPYVNYATLGKQEDAGAPPAPARPWIGGGELHAAVHSRLTSLDPASGNFTDHVEVISNVFECLTRLDDEARVVPWLAESFEAEAAAGRFRFRLRTGVRFQDGRRLTARDVRYSFERLLRSPERSMHFLLLPIRGAEALRKGESQELAGLRIVSASELVIELEEPLVFFPALLAHPGAAILPEDLETFGGDGRQGVGTGPFRVVRFEPGSVLELERNANYWRPGLPKSERLNFHLGVVPESMSEEFRAGRLSVVSSLAPNDVAALRRDPELAGGYREAPRLSTLFLALNARRGPLADPALRRSLRDRLALDELLRDAVGHQGVRAWSLIPPGLLGYEERRREGSPEVSAAPLPELRLQGAWIHAFEGQYGALGKGLLSRFKELGIRLEIVTSEPLEAERLSRQGSVDATFYRWVADYPDPDSFVTSLLGSKEGVVSGLVATPEIDRLAERGRRETDPALRHAVYREIEEILEREALLVPLFHEQNCYFSHPTVEGLRISFSLPEIPYDELSLRR